MSRKKNKRPLLSIESWLFKKRDPYNGLWNTLPETNVAMENPPFYWYLPGKMGIFMGYVSLQEGNSHPSG